MEKQVLEPTYTKHSLKMEAQKELKPASLQNKVVHFRRMIEKMGPFSGMPNGP